jgi:hypothetical protein
VNKLNWYVALKSLKIAARVADIQAITNWNNQYGSSPEWAVTYLPQLRQLLGNTARHLNEIAAVFKNGARSPTDVLARRASELLPDIANINYLHQALQQITSTLSQIPQQTDPAKAALAMTCQSMVHMLLNCQFTPQQAQTFEGIATNRSMNQDTFAEEMEAGRIGTLLSESVYSVGSPQDRTLKAIRECLQNAVDATLKKRKKGSGHQPQVDISMVPLTDRSFMDLLITDNGVGMDWELLSKKFFVYGGSGKADDPEAGGGFGIAKAIIQETPEEGWAIDTNGVHSSRFGKNMYMGTRPANAFVPAQSTIQPTPNGGTVLTLFRVPIVQSYQVQSLCRNYATSADILITVNHDPVEPTFRLKDMPQLDSSLKTFSGQVSHNDAEQTVIDQIVQKDGQSLSDLLGNLEFSPNGTRTSIRFYIQHAQYGGGFYCMINNQFQFKGSEYLERANIVCNILTNARPGTPEYPMDPGRENIRKPYVDAVSAIKNKIEKLLEKAAENDLFKKGLYSEAFNVNAQPLSFMGLEGEDAAASPGVSDDLNEAFLKEVQEKRQRESQNSTDPAGGDAVTEVAETYVESAPEMTDQQKAIARAAINAVRDQRGKRDDYKERMDDILEALKTPVNILVQKDFVSRQFAYSSDGVALTANTLLLWQKALKLVMESLVARARWMKLTGKTFMPGIIYSNECLALYNPPASGENDEDGNPNKIQYKAWTVAVNPLTVAGLVQPEAFEKLLNSSARQNAFSMAVNDRFEDAKLQEKLAKYIHHLAVHEMVHLIWPDGYGYDEFHGNISFAEIACHHIYPDILKETKKHFKAIKRNALKLLKAVSKDKAKSEKLKSRARKGL